MTKLNEQTAKGYVARELCKICYDVHYLIDARSYVMDEIEMVDVRFVTPDLQRIMTYTVWINEHGQFCGGW